jgi:hypothetical protein
MRGLVPVRLAGRTVTVSLFERHGFERTRRIGKNHWVVIKVVRPPIADQPPAAGEQPAAQRTT